MKFNCCYSLTLLVLISLSACKEKKPDEQNNTFTLSDTMLMRCGFSKAKLQDVKDELKLFGKVAADNNKMAHIYPITGGIVSEINVELGDYVKEGELLAVIKMESNLPDLIFFLKTLKSQLFSISCFKGDVSKRALKERPFKI